VDVVVFVIGVLLNGLVVGAVGRLLLPGRDPIGLPLTIVVGVVASAIGGGVGYLIFGEAEWVGLLLAFACAVGLVYLIRTLKGARDERVVLDPAD
jgi:uncharacterized membrane protein YeaQ/YmgE (transglycosylase-associated protein family)